MTKKLDKKIAKIETNLNVTNKINSFKVQINKIKRSLNRGDFELVQQMVYDAKAMLNDIVGGLDSTEFLVSSFASIPEFGGLTEEEKKLIKKIKPFKIRKRKKS